MEMPSKIRFFVLSLLLAPLLFVSNAAAETNSEVEQLKKQILEIQRQNQKQIEMLQQKIESMETKRASSDLKVEEFIAKKESEDEDAWWKGIRAGYKKGFFMESADGNFKTRFRTVGQFLMQVEDEDGGDTVTEFDIQRLRLIWDGNAFAPWFKYKVQLDIREDSINLRDLIFDFAYNPLFVPRVGQYKVPFNKEQLVSAFAQQTVNRSILDRQFSPQRDTGISIHGKHGGYFWYHVGVFQGEGRNSDEGDENAADSNILWAGRVMFNPLGTGVKHQQNFVKQTTIQLGAAIMGLDSDIVGEGNTALADETDSRNFRSRGGDFAAIGATDMQMLSWAFDVSLMHPRGNIEASYIGADYDPSGTSQGSVYDQGFRVQAGVFLIPKVLEVAARYAYVDLDDDLGDTDSIWEITPAVSYFLGQSHRWKVVADYSFIQEEGVDGTEEDTNRFRLQLQAYF